MYPRVTLRRNEMWFLFECTVGKGNERIIESDGPVPLVAVITTSLFMIIVNYDDNNDNDDSDNRLRVIVMIKPLRVMLLM